MDYTFNILDLVGVEVREDDLDVTWYSVDPAVVYPALLTHIGVLIKNRKRPVPTPVTDADGNVVSLAPNALEPLYNRAKQLPQTIWADAKKIAPGDGLRAEALEICRLWFTQLLQETTNGRTGIHILNDPAWKL